MRCRFALVAVLVGALAVLTGCGSSGASSGGGSPSTTVDATKYVDETSEATVVITARDDFFTPQFAKVRKGANVVFVNGGRNDHDVVAADNSFAAIETGAFAPGTRTKVVLGTVGRHDFYCSLHGSPTNGMYGSLLVVP